jgi:hypothetical protein
MVSRAALEVNQEQFMLAGSRDTCGNSESGGKLCKGVNESAFLFPYTLSPLQYLIASL